MSCWNNCRSGKAMFKNRIGDEAMRSDQMQMRLCGIGVALLVLCVVVGFVLAGLTKSPVGLFAGVIAGVYLLFSVRIADQWEKVAVLRFGRYTGLRGPGLFTIIPI